MISIKQLFSFSLWFSHHGYQSNAIVVLTTLSVAFILLGIFYSLKTRSIKKNKKPSYYLLLSGKKSAFFYLSGFTLLFFDFSAYHGIKIFSLRFWYIIWFVVFAFYAYHIYKFKKYEIPRREQASKQREERNKYLPKKKKIN